jgi:hypothetical protein
MAIRRSVDQDHDDVLTFAISRTVGDRPSALDDTRERVASKLEHEEMVALPNQSGVLYLSQGSAAETDKSWPARAQVLRSLPGPARIAILTLLSTKAGVEHELAADAREIAKSIGVDLEESTAAFHAQQG